LEITIVTIGEAFDIVKDVLEGHGLSAVSCHTLSRTIVASGAAEAIGRLLGIHIRETETAGGVHIRYEGTVTYPPEWQGLVEYVYGLDNAEIAVPHFDSPAAKRFVPGKLRKGYYPHEVARLYGFPQAVDGSGQCIALIELGGGYRQEDITQYFTDLRLPVPAVSHVGVGGNSNAPTVAASHDREVLLDILVAGAVAPGARIVVYFAPNNEQGFYSAITRAIHDEKNKPNIISISWGAPEKRWNKKALASFNELFKNAADMGITVCAAAGDHGSGCGMQDGNAHVDFPASSPYVLACGGTRLHARDGKIISEVVWHEGDHAAAGGGVSEFFPMAGYQANAGVPHSVNASKFRGRGIPDVAGNAAHGTGYKIVVNGQPMVIGGTSAVAPLYAGLVALLNQKRGKPLGFINPLLYDNPEMFRGIVKGNNITAAPKRGYTAAPGWNACAGHGVLCDHTKLIFSER
jgi:kumamolisin